MTSTKTNMGNKLNKKTLLLKIKLKPWSKNPNLNNLKLSPLKSTIKTKESMSTVHLNKKDQLRRARSRLNGSRRKN